MVSWPDGSAMACVVGVRRVVGVWVFHRRVCEGGGPHKGVATVLL